MKKRIVFALLALVMLLSLVSCGEAEKETATKEENATAAENSDSKAAIKDAETLLNDAWAKYEGEKFPVGGGDPENIVMDKAGSFDVKDTEAMTSLLHITEEDLAKVQDGAYMMHMMNQNTFTAAAYRVKSSDADAFVTSLKDSIQSTQWMCGFPEKLVIYTVDGEYVVAFFGNGEAIENFGKAMKTVYGDAVVLKVEEALA